MIRKADLIFTLSLLIYSNAQAGKIYKWTDNNGNVHYGESPPPEQTENQEMSIANAKKGDAECCSLVRQLVDRMLTSHSSNYSKKFDPLFQSNEFNVEELNNFVGQKAVSRSRRRTRHSNVSYSAYTTCMNAGFKFCRESEFFSADYSNKLGKSPKQYSKKSWSGTGFLVSKNGYIITNEHVAGSCKNIKIQPMGIDAKLVAKDAKYDLALLKIDGTFKHFAHFRVGSLLLGEDVITAGFPYKNLLSSSIKITTGIVSSLAGIQNDNKVIQITAPIQPGNSGGPLIDEAGNVVGVIVSKLSSEFMIRNFKEIPQNINFAIKGSHLKKFLYTNNVEINQKVSEGKLRVTNISQSAEQYTVEINCLNN